MIMYLTVINSNWEKPNGDVMNHLPTSFYVYPGVAKTTMTKAQAQETLIDTDGIIMANGHVWTIKAVDLGADVFQLSLER